MKSEGFLFIIMLKKFFFFSSRFADLILIYLNKIKKTKGEQKGSQRGASVIFNLLSSNDKLVSSNTVD